ncbi:hypothetical protein ACQY1Y_06675 [Microcystis ichthyoblabe FBCC-A1114]|uniref:hypothetical protein n=1 Tax=Microcystis TaxID=1125 RepID=UPI003D2946B4
MVRSPKSSAGAVGATLGNAPYGDGDRTNVSGQRLPGSLHPAQATSVNPLHWNC